MFKRKITRLAIPACTAILLSGSLSSCSDDLLTGQPSWLGESIYNELERRGNFKETLKLINAQDEDYASVLKKTGSKTLFVADDEAWAEFYKSNPWGITSMETMTPTQKKLIFKSNMVNSAYLVELLGNIPSETASEEPREGACMRRVTSVNIMDSVPLMLKAQFPVLNPARVDSTGAQIDYWSRLRDKQSAYILQDDGVATMIHFMPKFMQSNNIKSEDVEFMTNGEIPTNEGAFVNGKVVTERDVTCQNGYIHVLEGVALPLDNMANVLAANPQFSIYKRLLDRFSYPQYSASLTAEFQRQYGGQDSVFVRRYFNNSTTHTFGDESHPMDDGKEVLNFLPYDPGKNQYALTSNVTYQMDAAAMLVPTDEAMKAYLKYEGIDIETRFGKGEGFLNPDGSENTAWDNATDAVVLPLLKNTMLPSLKAAIPSQFGSITNTASETMNVVKADIDSTLWACNGVIYQTNKVYVAPEYVSVYYPCVVRANDDLSYLYAYLEKDATVTEKSGNNIVSIGVGFKSYLNNQSNKYSFVIPTNRALQTYYDPVSRYRVDGKNESTAVAYRFNVKNSTMVATPYLVDWTTLDDNGRGQIGDPYSEALTDAFRTGDVTNHLKDIVNSTFAPQLFVPGQKFYQAFNGGPIVVEWSGNQVTGVAGSFQYERGYFIPVKDMFDKSEEGNGRSYIIDDEPLMSTFTSPYAALTDTLREEQFGLFASLLDNAGITSTSNGNHTTVDMALTKLDNYHYTIYVPTNESVQQLMDAHYLPTNDDLDAVASCIAELPSGDEATDEENATYTYMTEQLERMKEVIATFVTYHIQDNSVYVEGEAHNNDAFESGCLDAGTGRFVKLYVNYTPGGQMTVTDNCGNVRRVDANCCNIMARQYYFASNTGGDAQSLQNATQIYSSSFAVIHQIDKPLVPNANSYYSPEDYVKVYDIIATHTSDDDTPDPDPNPIKRRIR